MKKPFGRKTLQERVRPIPNHKCELLAEIPPGINRIYQGICVEFRRKIWKWVTVDPYNPHSKKYLKSAALIHEQELYHLDKHPCIIHPFSKFRFIWEVIMIIVLLMLLFCIPLSIAKPQSDFDFLIVKLILDVICNIDIILWFFTGFYDKERQRVELHWGEIVKRYIKTFFIFDLLSSQPINLYVYLFDLEELEILVSLYLLKIVRVPTLIRYLYHLTERLNVLTSNIKFITFTIWIGVILTWSTSITYLSTSYTISKIVERRRINSNFPMLMTTFRMSRFLNLVGITEIFNLSNVMMMYQIVFIVIGSVLQIIILAKVMQFYQKRSSSRSRYDNLCEEMGEYMKYKELSLRLKGKILRYVNFKFQKHIFREEDVLKNLSSVLRHDILLHRCQSMIEKVDLFKDLPEHVIMRIVAKLRSEIFLPSDVIVLAGYSGNAMYFIYMGTVAVYTSNGKEICHLEDGSHFGEIALIINAPRTATVIAVKECELFKLNRRDFQEAIEPYPEINKKIKNLAMSRLETTLLMMAESQEDITNQFQSTKDLEEQRRFATTESTYEPLD